MKFHIWKGVNILSCSSVLYQCLNAPLLLFIRRSAYSLNHFISMGSVQLCQLALNSYGVCIWQIPISLQKYQSYRNDVISWMVSFVIIPTHTSVCRSKLICMLWYILRIEINDQASIADGLVNQYRHIEGISNLIMKSVRNSTVGCKRICLTQT